MAFAARKRCLTLVLGGMQPKSRVPRQRSRCLGGPSQKLGLALSRLLRRIQSPPVRSLTMGFVIAMIMNPDGHCRKRCKATASFAMIKHTEGLTASGPMAILCPWLWAIVIKGMGCKRPYSCSNMECKWQSCHHCPQGEMHTYYAQDIGVCKRAKRFAGLPA